MAEPGNHKWSDLVFDITGIDDRKEYLEEPGAFLPLTHEACPLAHAEMCQSLLAGTVDESWQVTVRLPVSIEEVDTSTLDECHRMMQRADEHAREASKPVTETPSRPPPSRPKGKATKRR